MAQLKLFGPAMQSRQLETRGPRHADAVDCRKTMKRETFPEKSLLFLPRSM
jgi:hypothetical protein